MSWTKVIIVGSNPSESSPTMTPFDRNTKTYKVLVDDILHKAIDGGRHIEFLNILDKKTPNNRPLSAAEIKEGLPSLKEKIERFPGFKIVGVGKTAQKALTLLGLDFFPLPHTSGLNRQWNDKDFKEQKINELRDYLSS